MNIKKDYFDWCKSMFINPTDEGLRAWDAAIKLVVRNLTDNNSTTDVICTCIEAICRYRSATEPALCLDSSDICKYKKVSV